MMNNTGAIERVSVEALEVLERVAGAADAELHRKSSIAPTSLAAVNTFTSGTTLHTLSNLDSTRRLGLESLAQEPAIARIVARSEDGRLQTYYICRHQTPSPKLFQNMRFAARNAPVGRLASLKVGDWSDELEIEIVEKALLRPYQSGDMWDSRDSILHGEHYGPITLLSMREALTQLTPSDSPDDLLQSILAADEHARNIITGIRRSVITKMGLRDQPILDRYQDEIFRLPLRSQLFIKGSPGTGKTTTLIRRVGQKLDRTYLTNDEISTLEANQIVGALPHNNSWMMFTPTELLKIYLKEAFASSRIPSFSATRKCLNFRFHS